LALSLAFLGQAPAVLADGPTTFTIYVKDSGGSAISGAKVYYRLTGSGPDNWTPIGQTSGSGTVTVDLDDGTYEFHAVYNETTATESSVSVPATTEVTFNTVKTTVEVKDSSSAPLDGVAIYYRTGYLGHDDWIKIGNTSGGKVEIETFAHSLDFHAVYHETTATQSGVASGSTVTFNTVKTTVEVKDSTNAPLDGVAVYYRTGYLGHDDWIKIGNTSGGKIEIETFPHSLDFHAVYHETTATKAGESSGTTVTFNTYKTVVKVVDCDGGGMSGVEIYYKTGYVGHDQWIKIGNTDASGQVEIEFFPRASGADFHARTAADWMTSTQSGVPIPASSPNIVTFQMKKVTLQFSGTTLWKNPKGEWKTFNSPMNMFPRTYEFQFDGHLQNITVPSDGDCSITQSVLLIRLKDSTGAGVPGGKAYLGVGGWPYIGDTDTNGVLVYFHNGLLGNMRVRMTAPNCGGSQDSPSQNVAVNSVYDFQTVRVVIQLKDSAGNLTNGGVVQAGCGGWPGIGTTGCNGQGTLYHERFPGVFNYRMSFNGTTEEQEHDVSTPFVFQTVQAVIQLQDHLGNPLDGGVVQFGIGGWPVIGTTGDGGSGQVTYEIFAGTYRFRMSYNHGAEEKQQDISTPVVFQTGLVKLHFSGSIKHGVGGWPAYTSPTEMLPISHKFRFSSSDHPTIDKWFTPTAGAVLEKSIVIVEFYDHAGNGIDGATVKYYHSGWKDLPGQTGDDGSGILFGAIDGSMGNLKVRLYYGGGSKEKTQHQPTDSYYVFQTQLVTVELRDSGDNLIDTGEVKYYASGWKDFGTTSGGTVSKELLPLSYKYSMSYEGGTAYQTTADATVTFSTHNVTVELRDSGGNLIDTGTVKYYASGWKDFGTTSSGVVRKELLPLSYKYSMSYEGGTAYQTTADATVTFSTHNVTVELRDSDGNLIDTGTVKYYASGWKEFGTTSSGVVRKELLPLSYKYSMGYEGGTDYQTTNASTVTFNTVEVTVRLQKGDGTSLSGGVAKYYASGWKSFGTTGSDGTVTKELLPLSYKFSMNYGGATNYVTQDVDDDPLVVFTAQNVPPTVKFTDSGGHGIAGALVKYYASGWKSFGTTDSNGEVTKDDLLPGTYKFSLAHGGATVYRTQDVAADPMVTFSTIEVTVELLDSNNNGLSGGAVKYYASGWKTFGTTDGTGKATKELLPLSYKFSMEYLGGTAYQTQDVSADPTVTFQTHLVTVKLLDSSGNTGSLPEEGTVKYYASGWKTFGTTSGGVVSKELLPLSYKFSMKYGGATNYQTTNTSLVEFQTTLVTVTLKNCDGDGIVGGVAKYYASGWKTFGTTDADGEAMKELLPLSYKFSMKYGGATNYQTQSVGSDPTVEFTTTTVTFQFGGTVKYYASGWKTFTSPMEMLPGTYKFNFGNDYQYVDISGCSMTKSIVILKLKDHNGNPLGGGTARGSSGSSYSQWHVPGSTAANGVLFDFHDGLYTTMSYEMRYNNTTAHKTQDITVNPVFEFQTNLLTLRLETCGGTPLDGGNPRYGVGSTYTTWWFPSGATGSSALGETAAEFFPGTYSFEMQYQSTADAKVSVTIPDADTTLTWQTTKVTLQYSGPIAYGGGSGDSKHFVKPSMELLPGTVWFNFRGGDPYNKRVQLTFSGCEFTKSVVVLKLLDSSGNGLAGGHFKYRFGWDSYTDIGTTDASGVIVYAIDGLQTKTKFNVTYLGASLEKEQNIATDSFVVFQTKSVTAVLNDSGGNSITSGVNFQYRYGWGTHQPLTGPTELLPVATKVKVTYSGASVEKEQNVGTNPNFVFQTVPVTAKLLASDGTTDLTSSATFQYRYGWGTHQPLTGPTELLPVATKVKVTYSGASVEKEQNVGTNPNFVFNTVAVTAVLNDHLSNPIGTGVSFQYRYGWDPYQPFTSPMELLPVKTKVKVSYAGTSLETEQNVNTNPNFVWQTGSVVSDKGTCTHYRYGWGSYMTFNSGMELLPVSTKFKFNDGTPETSYTISAGIVNHIH
jgi:hypothetical protein